MRYEFTPPEFRNPEDKTIANILTRMGMKAEVRFLSPEETVKELDGLSVKYHASITNPGDVRESWWIGADHAAILTSEGSGWVLYPSGFEENSTSTLQDDLDTAVRMMIRSYVEYHLDLAIEQFFEW